MDEDSQEDGKQLGPLFSRHRSPIFSKEEIKYLVNLIEKYKNIIQNKSINNAACHAKELAWLKIAKLYNAQGFRHKRSADSLKVKWDNLKRDARKISKNLIEVDQEDVDEITSQIVALINEAESSNEVLLPEDLNEEIKEITKGKNLKDQSENNWDENEERDTLNETDEGEIKKRLLNRSMNFSPQECSILLKCVRSEKKYVFNIENTGKAVRLKNRAWARITQCFNKISPQKRSTKMLRTKFSNMRRVARTKTDSLLGNDSNKKYMKLEDINSMEKIKSEPIYDYDDDTENDRDDDSGHNDDETGDNFNTLHSSNNINLTPDPLSVVLNSGDSGLESLNIDSCSDNKELINLKTQLLQYQLETAKLERRRIEAAMSAEAETNRARAAETTLRLRTARLEAVAAAMKLPHGHPALNFTPEETQAQHYLTQYHQT